MDTDIETPLDFDPQLDPSDPTPVPKDRVRKNIWISNKLVQDLEDLVAEDDSNLTVVIRQALQYYVRRRKEGTL